MWGPSAPFSRFALFGNSTRKGRDANVLNWLGAQFRPNPSPPSFPDKRGNYRENPETCSLFWLGRVVLACKSAGLAESGRCRYQERMFGFSGKYFLETGTGSRGRRGAGWQRWPRLAKSMSGGADDPVQKSPPAPRQHAFQVLTLNRTVISKPPPCRLCAETSPPSPSMFRLTTQSPRPW